MRSPCSLLFPRLTSPSCPSLPSQQSVSSPQIIAGASSGPSPPAPGLSCAEGSRAGHRTPGGVSPEQSRGAESPPSPCAHAAGDAAQGMVGLVGCQQSLQGHVDLLISQHPQVLLHRAAPNPFSAQLVFVLGIVLTLHLALLNVMRFAQAHLSNLSGQLWMASLPSSVSTAPHSLVLLADLVRMYSNPLSTSPTKMLNSSGPSIDP